MGFLSRKQTPQKRSGILAVGQLCVDYIKLVNALPSEGRTATVYKESLSTGGAALNLAIDLARLDYPDPVGIAGIIGQDLDGESIIQSCRSHRIRTDMVRATSELPTGYSDVFHSRANGRRISFLSEAANALLDAELLSDVSHPYRYLYLGTFGETPALSRTSATGSCVAADMLQKAKGAGMQTLIDVCHTVSIGTLKYLDAVLSHVDILLINEEVASLVTQMPLHREDSTALRQVGDVLMERYPLSSLVIHGPERSTGFGRAGYPVTVGAVRIPPSHIISTSGIRQAFAAGFLLELDNDSGMAECLRTANAVAAASAMHETNSCGIASLGRCMSLLNRYGERMAELL